MNPVTNSYLNVRTSYASAVTPVRKVQPLNNEKTSSTIVTEHVNDSVSISSVGRSYVNNVNTVNKTAPAEQAVTQINKPKANPVSFNTNKTTIEDVRQALGLKKARVFNDQELAKKASNSKMSVQKQMALSAYSKVMGYSNPIQIGGAVIQSLM